MTNIGIARDQRSEVEGVRDWHGHLAAGRIGSGPSTTAKQIIRHMRNEEAVLGVSRLVRFSAFANRGRAGLL